MSTVQRIIPNEPCPTCGSKLRRANAAEINIGLRDPDMAHFFAQATQGDMSKKTIATAADWLLDDANPGTWLLICDSCGCKLLHSRE